MQISPKEFVAELDKKIIGQKEAKKRIAVAVRNRWRRMQLAEEVRKDITPKNILMIGNTGVGKTALIKAMADIIDAPFLKVEATRYTQVGYYGENVESIIHQLADITHAKLNNKSSTNNPIIRNETPSITYEEAPSSIDLNTVITTNEISKLILESMITELGSTSEKNNYSLYQALHSEIHAIVKRVGYKGNISQTLSNNAGFYDKSFVKTAIKANPDIGSQKAILFTPDLSFLQKGLLPPTYVSGDDNVTKMRENLLKEGFNESKFLCSLYNYANPKDTDCVKQNKTTLINALLDRGLIKNSKQGRGYIAKYIDPTISTINDMVKHNKPTKTKRQNKAIDRYQSVIDCIHEKGIIFIDEIDKLADTSTSQDNVGKIGVQRDLLALLDGTEIDTRYGKVNTENIMFITAGAFSLHKVSDLIPELLGRLPIQIRLESMDLAMLKEILTNSVNSPLKHQILLLETEGVNVTVTDDGIDAIARFANYINTNYQNMGARTLHGVIDKIFSDVSFDAYKGTNSVTDFVIDNAMVSMIRREMVNEYDNEQFKQIFQRAYGYNH